MPKLPRLPAAEVVAALKRLGFEEVRQKGSHLVLRRASTNADGTTGSVICVVPLHRRDLAVGTLASVLRQAGVDGDTFIEALCHPPPRAMKIRYFPDTVTLTIELADRVSSSSEAVSDT